MKYCFTIDATATDVADVAIWIIRSHNNNITMQSCIPELYTFIRPVNTQIRLKRHRLIVATGKCETLMLMKYGHLIAEVYLEM